MPCIQYAFRDDAKNITMLTQGSTAACPLCQIVVLRKREIAPDFLEHFMAMDIKGTVFPSSALSDYGRKLEHTQDNRRYYAVIDSQIEFTVKPRTMQKLAEFMPAYTSTGLYNYFKGQPYGYLIVLKVYVSSEYIPDALMVKGRMGSAQIIQLYDKFGERTQMQIADNLKPLIDPGTFDYIKYEILHTLRVENALIGVYGSDDDSKRLLKQKRNDYNEGSGQHKHTYNEDDDVDRSQTDYEETYSRVVELAPSLTNFIDYVRNIKPPQMVEWQAMIQRILSGDQQAKHRIVEMYLRNIIRISLHYAEKYQIPIEDVIQDGVIGMMSAIEKFDASKIEAFHQYYPFWVRQTIQRKLPQYLYACYIPMHLHKKLLQIRELALAWGYTLSEDVESYDSAFVATVSSVLEVPFYKAIEYLGYTVSVISIEEMLETNPEGVETEASLKVDTIGNLVNTFGRQHLHDALEATLATLTPREAQTLRLRNGLDDGRSRTLEEIGKKYNVSRERVRQIEAKSLRKIRHPNRLQKLKDYLD